MFFILLDRPDRLGSHIMIYIGQILFAHKNRCIIRFREGGAMSYKYYSSLFVRILFDYIENQNAALIQGGIEEGELWDTLYGFAVDYRQIDQFLLGTTTFLYSIECDYLTYFRRHIWRYIRGDVRRIRELPSFQAAHLPFSPENTILIHLRLDDVAMVPDYDGASCAEYYRTKIENCEICTHYTDGLNNRQAPLSRAKLDEIIYRTKAEHPDRKVVLLTSPGSDTSSLPYDVIKNEDANYDLFLLTQCEVVVLSRSTFAFASLFFRGGIERAYIPIWGHFVCFGLTTEYDMSDKSKFEYFT